VLVIVLVMVEVNVVDAEKKFVVLCVTVVDALTELATVVVLCRRVLVTQEVGFDATRVIVFRAVVVVTLVVTTFMNFSQATDFG
jgi:hypothetical protein